LFGQKFEQIEPQWKYVQQYTNSLLDSKSAFRCLLGYLDGEKKLFSGARTGDVGSKRKKAIETYGYSPKNYVHCVRLAWSGIVFFQKGIFPVYMPDFDTSLAASLIGVRKHPEYYDKAALMDEIDGWEEKLKEAYADRNFHFEFNEEIANQICLDLYFPILRHNMGRREKEVYEFMEDNRNPYPCCGCGLKPALDKDVYCEDCQ
jgi:hypothetical protein